MKRGVAIRGATPAHLRWALQLPCPIRTWDERQPTLGALRQVRPLQELSRARAEGRVYQSIGFHPAIHAHGDLDGDEILGFLEDEVAEAYGGAAWVEEHCGSCPANALGGSRGWAGCAGWVAFPTAPDGAERLLGQIESGLQRALDERGGDWPFRLTRPLWYGLWSPSPLGAGQAGELLSILSQLRLPNEAEEGAADFPREWTQLRCGVEAAARHSLPLYAEWVPAGDSDGVRWSLPAHCGVCRFAAEGAPPRCPCCGEPGPRIPARRRRVLGLRPYLNLIHILGRDEARRLATQYLQAKERD